MTSLTEAPYLDIFDPEIQVDPSPHVEALRKESPVLRTPIGALVVDRKIVLEVLRDRTFHSALMNLTVLQGVANGPLYDQMASSLLAQEGADHTRLRRLVSRSFTPRAADTHRPFMRQLATELVEQFAPAGECEFVTEFGDHYPVQVIAHLMGVPREDHPQFAKWGDVLTLLLSMELYQHRAEIEAASEEMGAYLDALVVDRRQHPREDLVSELIAARDGGDRLNDNELMTLLAGLLFAGYDTTRNQLAVAMTVFAERPEDWAQLAARPELVPAAVEEVMRTAGIVTVTPRIATAEVELAGWTIPAGTVVMVSLIGANHDPGVYPDPNRFDMYADRPDGQVTFGGGAHHCLGANLARAEMQEALPVLARAMPNLRVAELPEWRSPLIGIKGPTRLRLAFGAAK